jgi:hypothetical protein
MQQQGRKDRATVAGALGDARRPPGRRGSALIRAIEVDSERIVQLLLERGAALDGRWGSAFRHAWDFGNDRIIQLLLAEGV